MVGDKRETQLLILCSFYTYDKIVLADSIIYLNNV